MFLTKKIIAVLVYPLLFGLLLALAGLLLARPRWRLARRLAIAGILLVAVAAMPAVATLAARTLEAGLVPVDAGARTSATAIVVLSGGSYPSRGGGAWDALNGASIRRVLEGVRLKRAWSDLPLILSGGSTSGAPHALAMAELAVWSGVPAADLQLELDSRDTREQAQLLAARVGTRPFYLVTSATHMPRSLALFRQQGLQPLPAPTDFIDNGIRWRAVRTYLPTAHALEATTRSVHEWYGLAWSRLRGQL